MNQKHLKYPLIVAVTLVWGLIIYRVANGLGSDDSAPVITAPQKKINYNQPEDSFILIANYPDPFIPEDEVKDTPEETAINPMTTTVTGQPTPATATPLKQVFDPSVIQYTGMIYNPDKKLKVAIMNIAGKEYLVKERESINGCMIKSIRKDKVVVTYKGSSYAIEKAQ